MARLSLSEIKEKLKQDKKNSEEKGKGFSNGYYPFWNIPIDSEAVIRILPDKNEDNPFIYYVQRYEHKIDINGERKTITCPETFGESCPICTLSRSYYKADGNKSERGKYYYRSTTNLTKVLVVKDPQIGDDGKPLYEGKILTTTLNKPMITKIASEISADDFSEIPWDYTNGVNFVLRKGEKMGDNGKKHADWTTSGFARRPTDIPNQDENLVDLRDLLPRNLGTEEVEKLLEAHLNGGSYEAPETTSSKKAVSFPEVESYAKVTKPDKVWDINIAETKPQESVSSAPATNTAVTESNDDEDDEDDEDEIIASIRNRTKAR